LVTTGLPPTTACWVLVPPSPSAPQAAPRARLAAPRTIVAIRFFMDLGYSGYVVAVVGCPPVAAVSRPVALVISPSNVGVSNSLDSLVETRR
jgi:hypothetical protein